MRLDFQPEVELVGRRVVAAEALARWDHPVAGTLDTERFVSFAEQHGLVGALGEWALRAACIERARWEQAVPGSGVVVRVNISPLQLSDARFPSLVESTLREAGVQPRSLCIEVTETAEPSDPAVMRTVLQRLRCMGVLVAIDDFGAGRNGLLRLREARFDLIKIDRAFVTDLGTDADSADARIVAAVLRIAADFGMEAVAEGVETEDAAAELRRLGCHRAQGRLFGEPMASAALVELLRQ